MCTLVKAEVEGHQPQPQVSTAQTHKNLQTNTGLLKLSYEDRVTPNSTILPPPAQGIFSGYVLL